MDIVVIEDNDTLRGSIIRALTSEGHRVAGFDSAEEFIEGARSLDPDLLLIDLNLPGEDGLSLTSRIRGLQPDIGIIIMTARTASRDKRAGYELGADIYLTKPVTSEELNAAVGALGRRIAPTASSNFELLVDLKRKQLRGQTGVATLSASEISVLVGFLRAPGNRLETWQIAEMLDQGDTLLARNAINVAIFRLNRKLIEAGAESRRIRAIRNWGYELSAKIGIAGQG